MQHMNKRNCLYHHSELLHFSGLHVSPCFHAKKRKNANSIHSMVSNKEEREKDLQIAQILDQPDHKGC